jgi:hypothetical protein
VLDRGWTRSVRVSLFEPLVRWCPGQCLGRTGI